MGFLNKLVSLSVLRCRSSLSGGQRQSSASTKKRWVWTHTHSTPRQPRESNVQGRDLLFLDLRILCCSRRRVSDIVCVFPAAAPEDVSVAFALQSAHGEAARLQSALPAHCSLSLPSALQGALRLWGGAAARHHPVMITQFTQSRALTYYFIVSSLFPDRIYFSND